jgi:hypothetical protein
MRLEKNGFQSHRFFAGWIVNVLRVVAESRRENAQILRPSSRKSPCCTDKAEQHDLQILDADYRRRYPELMGWPEQCSIQLLIRRCGFIRQAGRRRSHQRKLGRSPQQCLVAASNLHIILNTPSQPTSVQPCTTENN